MILCQVGGWEMRVEWGVWGLDVDVDVCVVGLQGWPSRHVFLTDCVECSLYLPYHNFPLHKCI